MLTELLNDGTAMYLGAPVGRWAASVPLLTAWWPVHWFICYVWRRAATSAFGTDTDPVSRAAASIGTLLLTVALLVNPFTVALWMANPGLAWVPMVLALVWMLLAVLPAWAHVLRVALLSPAVVQVRAVRAAQRPALLRPLYRELSARQQYQLGQAAAQYELDDHGNQDWPRPPARPSQPLVDRIAHGLETDKLNRGRGGQR